MFLRSLTLSLATAMVAIAPVFATSNMWTIDPDHSAVTFKVKHMSVSTVSGEFKQFSGTVNYDGKNLRDAAVEAKINTLSVDTQSKKRDEHLKSKSFLDASEFPDISFKSQKIVPGEQGAFKIKGVISIHGFAREVTLDAEPLKEIRSLDTGVKRMVTSATTYLNRKDFGVSMGALDKGGALIGDRIQVTLNIELIHSESAVSPTPSYRRSGREVKIIQLTRVAARTTCDDNFHA